MCVVSPPERRKREEAPQLDSLLSGSQDVTLNNKIPSSVTRKEADDIFY